MSRSDIDVQGFDWGNAVGAPTLGAIQGTVVSAGYDNDGGGIIGDLNPKGWPGTPGDGSYQAKNACGAGGDGSPCVAPFDPTCAGGTNGFCFHNPDWIMPACANDFGVPVTSTLDYKWSSAAQIDCNTDDGNVKTFGGLILEVPSDAAGTYVIAWDPDPNNSFMVSGAGVPIAVSLTPACITIIVDCNGNGIDDADDIATCTGDPACADCNDNGIPDGCELVGNDCNTNDVPDECELVGNDCNTSGIPDECELIGNDCNNNGIPDECEADCQPNGIPDDCDADPGDPDGNGLVSDDCNGNGIPDECELVGNDCNTNDVPDECELVGNDCNNDGVPDECELVGNDCNINGIPDECEADCQPNGVPDECDVNPGDPDGNGLVSDDCNSDGVPDECEPDCNNNNMADECDIADCAGDPACGDCNGNGIPDECDIADCTGDPACDDCQPNGIPDSCDIDVTDPDGNGFVSDDCNNARVPDECSQPPGAPTCIVTHPAGGAWSVDATWQSGTPPVSGDSAVIGSVGRTAVTVDLDINPTVSALRLLGGSTLNMTDPSVGNLTIDRSEGTFVNGKIVISQDRAIDALAGPFEIVARGEYKPDAAAVTSISASLSADTISIVKGLCSCPDGFVGGLMELTDSMFVSTTGDFHIVGSNVAICDPCGGGRGGITPIPRLSILQQSGAVAVTMEVGGNLIITGNVGIDFNTGILPSRAGGIAPLTVLLSGNFVNHSLSPESFDWTSALLVMGGMTTQSFELASEDIGAGAEGFISNFAMSTLEISSGTTLHLVDEFDNTGSGAVEALFVDMLILRADSELVLNNGNAYYNTLVDEGGGVTLLGTGRLGTNNDCNNNGVPDEFDISDCIGDPACGDCNGNGIPDECDADFDGDGVPDDCDPCPTDNPDDSDGDGVCDSVDICPGGDDNIDGDGDGVPDACDPCPADNPDDSDGDGVCDSLDLCPGGDDNLDNNGNGIPDECDVSVPLPVDPGSPNDRLKNRYVSFKPNNPGVLVKFEVTLTGSLPHPDLLGSSWWVQAPAAPGSPLLGPGECVALLGAEALAAQLDWDAAGCQTLHVTGCPVEPTSDYEVRAVADVAVSDPLPVATIIQPGVKWWGDTVGFFNGTEWTPPNNTTNIDDAVAAIKTWQGGPVVAPVDNIAHLSVADVEPGNVNAVVNFNDVFTEILAFTGATYPFGPADADGNCP